ncbi:MAG: hypothetical protein P4K83_01710 [Terracidiphilus sp.]|nr:hypothetical protein [Terracidiphilus sp.]
MSIGVSSPQGPSQIMLRPNAGNSLALLVMRIAVGLCATLILITGAGYQLEMFVTGGRAPIGMFYFKLGVLSICLMSIGVKGRVAYTKMALPIYVLFVYIFLDAPHLIIQQNVSVYAFAASVNALYFIFVVLLVVEIADLRLPEESIRKVWLFCFAINGALALAQFIQNEPIVYTGSTDGNFVVDSWVARGSVRAFGLFAAPGAFALFSGMVATYAAAKLVRRKGVLINCCILVTGFFFVLIAKTRGMYVVTIEAVITAILLAKPKMRPLVRFIPLAWFVAGIGVAAFSLIRLVTVGTTSDMTDATSFGDRIIEWKYFLNVLTSSRSSELLFGLGWAQDAHTKESMTTLSIDNLYLAITLHTGIVGLVLVLLVLWACWIAVYERVKTSDSELIIAAAAIFSTVYSDGVYQGSYALAASILIFAYLIPGGKRLEDNEGG